jgi:hypothetical protein
MAMTASITVSPSTYLINQEVNATLTVSNSGSQAVNVINITPTAIVTGGSPPGAVSCALGVAPLGPGQTVQVSPSSSLAFGYSYVFFAPSTGPIGAGDGTYSIGALVSSSDGSNFAPTAAEVTVNPLPLPESEGGLG